MNFGGIFSNRLINRWLKYYILLIMLLIASVSLTYYKLFLVIYNQTDELYMMSLKQFQKNVDQKIEEVKNICIQLNFNQRNNTISYTTQEDYVQKLAVYNLVKDLKSIRVSNSFIEDIAIYYPENKFVVTSTSKYSLKQYYSFNPEFKQYLPYDDWYNFIGEKHDGKYIIIEKDHAKYKYLHYIQTFPIEQPLLKKSTLIIKLDLSVIDFLIENIEAFDKGSIYIFDSSKQNIYHSANIRSNFSEVLASTGILDGKKLEPKNYNIKMDSPITNWTYIYASNLSINKTLKYAGRLIGIALVLLFCVGSLIFYIAVKGTNKPIYAVKKLLGVNKPHKQAFVEIESVINNLKQCKEKYQNYQLDMKNYILIKLVEGSVNNWETCTAQINENKEIVFDKKYYNVIVCNIDNADGPYQDPEKYQAQLKAKTSALYTVKNVMDDIFKDYYVCYWFSYRGQIVGISNDEGNTVIDSRSSFNTILTEGINYLRDKKMIDLTVSISDTFIKLVDASKAYTQAQGDLQFRMIQGTCNVIYSREVRNSSDVCYNQDVLQFMGKIKKSIACYDFKQAQEFLHGMFIKCFYDSNMPIQYIRCKAYALIDIIAGIIREFDTKNNSAKCLNESEFEGLMNFKTLNNLENSISSILEKLSNSYYDKENKKCKSLADDITKYIADNYFDVNLNVNAIAGYFHMTAANTGKLYKQVKGEGLLNAIHTYRLDRAKSLLQRGMSVSETAQKVGYVNAMTFIRIFKKYEGITPGKYSDMSDKSDVFN